MTRIDKDTIKAGVFLPRTDFPMRAGLPKMEPGILAHWEKMDFYRCLRARRKAEGAEPFILHDGPPYANGHLHTGTALNKILKDLVNRFQSALGRDVNYVPGWDCHGLPIEWKIEEQYRKKGRNKDDVPVVEFRRECREFAAHWMGVQEGEFRRLGVMGDWGNPYTTMRNESEAVIAAEIGKFLMNGGLFRGAKPVMWSAAEKTALAEAEIEYADHTSTTIYARFPVAVAGAEMLRDAVVIIWTTTPWTMPGNRACAYGEHIEYGLWRDKASGERLVLADALADTVAKDCGREFTREGDVPHAALAKTILRHPLHAHGYDHKVPLLAADYVTTEQGTGIVHIAPGHGAEDYVLGMAAGIEVPETVGADGRIMEHLPLFAGMSALKDNEKIADILQQHGALIGRGKLNHSYPHSWRSRAPLIFRNTPQWFISMQTNDLRKKALAAIDATEFFPPQGQRRLRSMIESRPDWCISRQRAWGVPIPVFVHRKTGEALRDEKVMARIIAAFRAEGADAWFASPPSRFLGDDYAEADYEQVRDIVDVWFDSGSTHAFVLEDREDMRWPADMYLEGSDQHRGWFHSSLLEACGTRGRAPYKSILTHGFVQDEQGRKMSKSLGNTVAPQDVIAEHGADILRLWVANSDYYDDLRIGKEILARQSDHYRRLRNTLRYLLGALAGFTDDEKIAPAEMPEMERWMLHRIYEVDEKIRIASAVHDYHAVFVELHKFCNNDLSAFYFDVRKDVLYCGDKESVERRAVRSTMHALYNCLVRWLAPVLCFTAEEAWLARNPGEDSSVHLETWPDIPASWRNDELGKRWETVREARLVVNGAIEKLREAGEVKSSLDAHVILAAPQSTIAAFEGLDAADIFITSAAALRAGKAITAKIEKAEGRKCARCWKILPEVGAEEYAVCNRCREVMANGGSV